MTTITLQPITLTFTQTCKISVEEYLEWCEMYENIPSQKGYKRFVIDYFEDDLRDDINPDNFTFKYGKEKEYEYEEIENGGIEIPFDYSEYIDDLSESEIEEFHKLVEEDKFNINPIYTKDDIVIMNSIENLSLDYGVKINKETGEILCIKKSIQTYHLYEYLRTLEKPSQGHSTDPVDAL
jgi:hypothetical protein